MLLYSVRYLHDPSPLVFKKAVVSQEELSSEAAVIRIFETVPATSPRRANAPCIAPCTSTALEPNGGAGSVRPLYQP